MQIDAAFITEFRRLAVLGDRGIRLTAATSRFHTESSLRPLFLFLNDAQARHTEIEFVPDVRALITRIPPAKQRKYSQVIKFVEKTLTGQESKIFATLRNFSEKLSKSQQRYTNPLIGDAGHGLCSEMALCWLDEQFRGVVVQFPRLATGNVVGSSVAYDVTTKAMTMSRLADLDAKAAHVNLNLTTYRLHAITSFDTFDATCQTDLRGRVIKAYLIAFFDGQHAVAIFREDAGTYQFYDANAGSYRIQPDRLTDFLRNYNNVCLPRKWHGYNRLSTAPLDRIFIVSRRA